MTSDPALIAASPVEARAVVRMLARIGYAVNGLLHVLLGVVAIAVAAGVGVDGSGSPRSSGALGAVGQTAGGGAAFWAIAVGFGLLGLWRIALTFLLPTGHHRAEWVHRATELSTAAAYLIVSAVAFTFVQSAGDGSSAPTLGARLLTIPGGVDLLTLIGLVVIVFGTVFILYGARRHFMGGLSVPDGALAEVAVTIGVVAYFAKGIVLCIMGILLVIASLSVPHRASTGLDGAVGHFAQFPLGAMLFVVIGVGLGCYALYCGVQARFARF